MMVYTKTITIICKVEFVMISVTECQNGGPALGLHLDLFKWLSLKT
jgi:hypothetical protein